MVSLDELLSKASQDKRIFIRTTDENELQTLVNEVVEANCTWGSTSVPEKADVSYYAKKPIPGIVLYGPKEFYFCEASRCMYETYDFKNINFKILEIDVDKMLSLINSL